MMSCNCQFHKFLLYSQMGNLQVLPLPILKMSTFEHAQKDEQRKHLHERPFRVAWKDQKVIEQTAPGSVERSPFLAPIFKLFPGFFSW